jgi:hypothetical protein
VTDSNLSGVYAFAFFLPLILRQGLGYSLELSFVLSAFPPCFAVIVVMTVSWLADKYHVRGLPVIGQGLFGIIGLCMTGFLDAPVPRYIGTFLGYAGAIGLVVTSMSWMANNLRGDGKRAIATAVMISISGVGGIYSSLVFRQQVRTFIQLLVLSRSLLTSVPGCPQLHSRTCCCDGSQFFCCSTCGDIDDSIEDSEQTCGRGQGHHRRIGRV